MEDIHSTINAIDLKAIKRTKIFIETGFGQGGGVQAALKAGFEEIWTIEAYETPQVRAMGLYGDNKKVTVVAGDSGVVLPMLLDDINDVITFWLDAHYTQSVDTPKIITDVCPIMVELEAIKNHHINTHTILVDDMGFFRRNWWRDRPEIDIVNAVLAINPEYDLWYSDDNNMLIAEPPPLAEIKET